MEIGLNMEAALCGVVGDVYRYETIAYALQWTRMDFFKDILITLQERYALSMTVGLCS